jgi:hypothetical protein
MRGKQGAWELPRGSRSGLAQAIFGLGAAIWPSLGFAAELPLPPPHAATSVQMLARSPQWDVGVTLGGGVYESGGRLDRGAFRLGLELDSIYLRRREADFGLGWTLSASTWNFGDARLGLGVLGTLQVLDPLSVELALRGGIVTDGNGASPSLTPELRLGLRSLNLKGQYSHAHLLALGTDFTFATDELDTRPRASIYAALRFDVMWLVAPVRAIFK